MSEKTALVAMSGGVDSSVAAALMAEAGWRTVGVTLKIMPGTPSGFGCCGSPADIDDAKRVCESLGLAHYTLNMADLFEDKVIKPFVEAYLNQRTPNPCVECNKSVKFGHLMALARAWGADCLATGHYAKTENGRLFMSEDREKDQSYFLYALGREELAGIKFPLGEMTKGAVREKARELKLKTAEKPESQEICFVPGRDYRSFIAGRIGESSAALTAGPIKDTQGKVLGRHRGLASYTCGQRKGLGISAAQPSYVVRMEPESNTLVVGSRQDTFSSSFIARGVSWISGRTPDACGVDVRIRHRHKPASALLNLLSPQEIGVRFLAPQPAVTPGQAAVFYSGDEVLGGGTIAEVANS
ncbi:MAG TPA: tRNA 2-thiouridine(34) synthase MnmA [Elusimicrobiota bacterium]|nr:tRNA 2-thiouridine(34) synthase MnmA [Elusimicrobiota bacterium]